MADALNAGELALLDLVEADIRAASEGPGGSKLLLRDITQFAGMVRRLVGEVERLRSRNEALEKVAKVAGELFVDEDPGIDFIEMHVADNIEEGLADEFGRKCHDLRAALSALNPPKLDGSGGGT